MVKHFRVGRKIKGQWWLLILLALTMAFWLGAGAVYAESGSVLVVTKTEDTNDGVCDDDCSLREALNAANAGDTVEVPGGTYTVVSELTIFSDVEIRGEGADSTFIQAGESAETSTHGVIGIFGGVVQISGVTIRHGNGIIGGGIVVEGASADLTLTDSVVKDNAAFGGAGIANNFASVKTVNSLIEGNSASLGGGILSSGKLNIENSTVRGNDAEFGGGLYVEFDTVNIQGSTFNENSANQGGAVNIDLGEMNVLNSTLSGNQASESGGGIFVGPTGIVKVHSSTVAFNSAGNPELGIGEGGGIVNGFGGTASIGHTILSNNSDQMGKPECSGTLDSLGHNLILNASGCDLGEDDTNIFGADAMLGALEDNGGATETHKMPEDSPAVDSGDVNGCVDAMGSPLASDQRGIRRPADGNEDGSAICDIGAYELSSPFVTLFSAQDSFVRRILPNINEGSSPLMNVQGLLDNRAFVKFDLDNVSTDGLISAKLVLNIAARHRPFFGYREEQIEVYQLTSEWSEGNGKLIGVPLSEITQGSGEGITWNCAADPQIENHTPDCDTNWQGGTLGAMPEASAATAIAPHMTGEISWDVTSDVRQGAKFGWMIKGESRTTGSVYFYSKEAGEKLDNPAVAPRLILEYEQ